MMQNVVKLPAGMHVVTKPDNLEAYCARPSMWTEVVDTLKVIDAEKCIEIDIAGADKKKILAIKHGIKHASEKLRFKYHIKFAIKGNTLFVWSNR